MHPIFLLLLFFFYSADATTPFSSKEIQPEETPSVCSQTFACGPLQGLSYPFTGGARPAHCGPPEFHISCVDDSPELTIMSLRYRVLELDPVHKNLRLVRSDLWNSTCTDKLANVTIKSEFFAHNENDDMEVSIFYGCNSSTITPKPENWFHCNVNLPFNDSYYLIGTVPIDQIMSELHLHQMDVKTAFLNGNLKEDIYMKQPEGFIQEKGENLVCKLCKSIYGLKQASRQWYIKFDEVVKQYGFTENALDECIYMKVSGRNFIILVLYVDDILLACTDLSMLHNCKEFLSKHFEMTDLGEATYVLGIEISRNREKGTLGLSQKNYIEKVLQRFNMLGCGGTDMPISKGDKLSREQAPKTEQEKADMSDKPYASLVGSLMYAQVCTRPDIAFPISVLGRFQSNPGQAHWVAGKRVLRYLKRTMDYKLVFKRSDSLTLEGFADADFAGCKDDLRSTSGYVFTFADAAVSWRSIKQSLTVASTMLAEFLACYEATAQAMWLKNFITSLKIVDSIHKPVQLWNDNSAAVLFAKGNKRTKASRILDVKFLTVKEKIRDGYTVLDHISTNDMVADPLTKGLPKEAFHRHVQNMGLMEDKSG